jgi:hypothetical protein
MIGHLTVPRLSRPSRENDDVSQMSTVDLGRNNEDDDSGSSFNADAAVPILMTETIRAVGII